ncbi:MAG: hypothetical protein QOK21_23 [Solirubrobacteraceae bacterium]|jgi:hypothetical protein|nr:hypothetical protein [Solirubrobacteraceae bacterium]
MTLITDTWRQIVERRLWPIALLLLAALVAVPVLLAKSPTPAAPVPTASAPATDQASELTAKPIVSPATNVDDASRRVLGTNKDPFRPAVVATPTPTPTPTSLASGSNATAAGANGPAGSASSGTTSSGSSTSGGSGSPAAPTTPPSSSTPSPSTTPSPAKPKTYPLYSLTVRFGDASGQLTKQRLKRLAPLPDADTPVAIYLGPGPDKRSAVFLVDASVTPQGDGTCKPYPADCQTVTLHEGDTEFFDAKDATTGVVKSTYELDLINIVRKTTSSARKATVAAHATSKAGARVLRKRIAQSGPLRWAYDRSSGTVARLATREWKATVARAGRQVARVVAVLQPGM